MTLPADPVPTDQVEEVAPGVHRIPVVLPNEGLRSVNVYALVDDDGVDLVDCGMHTDESRAALTSGLAQLGKRIDDVRDVYITHHHLDHYSLATALRREHRFTLHLGAPEIANLRAIRSVIEDDAERSFAVDMRRVGFPSSLGAEATVDAPILDPDVWSDPDRWLQDGDVLTSRGHTLAVLATPGHTRGHVVLHDAEHGLLLTGDHILPRITPSIGFESSGRPRAALSDYLRSLMLVLDLPDARMLPAHGAIHPSTHARVHELLAHHERRLAATGSALRATGRQSTPHEIAVQLTWTRRERRIEDLEPFDQYLAAAETAAHLDLLVERGAADRTSADGEPDRYRSTTDATMEDHA